MALWGAAMAANANCTNVKKYQKQIPKARSWITEKEEMYIETALSYLPDNVTCIEMTKEAALSPSHPSHPPHLHNIAAQIREKYPKHIDSELLFGMLLKPQQFSAMDAISFIRRRCLTFTFQV